jgi:glycosyltransferase involved in cell wall biosynthesis
MFRTLSEEHPDLVAEVCGDGVLLPVAMGAAERFGGRLRILGRVEDADLREAYQRARVFVMPSRFEGLGLVALEAMACGTPVVGMDVPGLRDMRDTGITLVKLDDQKALHDEVNRLLLDGARWRELSAQALEVVRTSYSWEAVRPRIAEVYRSVLPSSSTQAA